MTTEHSTYTYEDGISRDEWARRDRAAWTAYMDGRTPTKESP